MQERDARSESVETFGRLVTVLTSFKRFLQLRVYTQRATHSVTHSHTHTAHALGHTAHALRTQPHTQPTQST